jgi:two-component system sensor histidine kinase/response regulator
VMLTAHTIDESETTVRLRFDIRDTGLGIAPDDQKKLFQSFTQVDPSNTRRHGGTGLGLAISKQLVQMMNGQIGVSSEPGVGSTFWFTALFTKVAPEARALPTFEGRHICILSKSVQGNDVLAHYLEEFKCSSTLHCDPQEALNAVRTAVADSMRYDAIIIDDELSGISGFHFAQNIRTDPLLDTLRIIIVIPTGKRGKTSEIMKKGIDGYLAKPFIRSHIANTLSLVFDALPSKGESASRMINTRRSASGSPSNKRYRILLAEDNVVIQMVIQRILSKNGYHCNLAVNGVEACEAHRKCGYDLILMDCQMPLLSGYDATKAIREDEAKTGTKRTPIIALTANALPEDKLRCMQAGMDDYLSKPIDSIELIAKIESWCASDAEAPGKRLS